MRYALTAILAIAATVCQARTIYVDANGTGDYPTIQAAVDNSNTGDVITLFPGRYTGIGNRDIDSQGKSITVQSTDPCDPAIVAATVIDCQRIGRGFIFLNGERPLLAGFTIINGQQNSYLYPLGDAIYSRNSNPTIFNCVIKKSGSISGYSTGSAIVCDNSSINLIGCTIKENIVALDYMDSNAEITGCTISKNARGISLFGSGDIYYLPVISNTVRITDSIIADNNGAIGCSQTDLTIERSTISDNKADGYSGINAQYSNVVITDSVISRNKSFYSHSSELPDAGGVASVNGTLDMNNCVISDNKALYYGGGITSYGGAATIRNCTITNNTAGGLLSPNRYYDGKGGGIYAYAPTQLIIEGCTIKGNKTESNPVSYTTYGGGIYSERGSAAISIKKSSITGNKARQGGGVLANSTMIDINNCLLANNEAEIGGGIRDTGTTGSRYVNCTFVGNKAVSATGLRGNGIAENCIFWDDILSGNAQGEISGIRVSYSNVRWPKPDPGGSNISIDPMFTFENDGHLLPGSPCIDAGTNTPINGLAATDLDGNPRTIDGDSDGLATVDMGAFEFNSAVSRLAISDSEFTFSCAKNGPNPEPQVLQIRNCNGGNLDWEIMENCPWLNVSLRNGTSSGSPSSVTITLDANQLDIGTYQADMLITSPGAAGGPQTVHVTVKVGRLLSVPQNFNTIQNAIDEANNGDWVVVADGTYTGTGNRDIDFRGKAITVCSQNGPETCIIDCNGTPTENYGAFVFQTGETSSSILNGFTITNGYNIPGGGTIKMNSTPTIKNCVFIRNTAPAQGGAILALTPPSTGMPIGPIVIKQCSFIENSAISGGGAIYSRWSLKLTDCNFIENVVTDIHSNIGGGGIGLQNNSSTSCSALIEGCNFIGNFAGMGGAINAISINTAGNISIMNSTFIGNAATNMGGALFILEKFNTTISNSVIAGNRARSRGGIGLYGPSQITNCTIAGNASFSAEPSSAILSPDAKIRNCIFADYGPRVSTASPDIKYNNVRGGLPLEGNIDIDPGFVRPGYWADPNNPNVILEPNDANAVWVNGDYHLLISSPCIDAGDPNYVQGTTETDLDGNPRVVDGDRYDSAVVDMGAYEYQNTAPVADAGPNQMAYAWIDGIAEVTLDANNSYDADGDALTYLWKWSIDGNDYETNGVNPMIELPVGQYMFELMVNDGIENSEPNQVVVTVVEPVQATLWVTPRVINNGCFGQRNIMAMIRLPAGISKRQVDAGRKLLLYPGGIEANRQFVMSYYDCRRVERVVIWAYFNSDSLTHAVTRTGWVNLDVVGQLKTGQYFGGSDRVWVVKPPRRPVWHWQGWGCGF